MPAHFESGLIVGESAWHKQGNVIPADDDRRFNLDSCIELAGLDWSVEIGDCYFLYGPEGEHVDKVDGSFVTLRQRADGGYKPLGVVGSKYRPLQNREAFEWFQPWLDSREVAIAGKRPVRAPLRLWPPPTASRPRPSRVSPRSIPRREAPIPTDPLRALSLAPKSRPRPISRRTASPFASLPTHSLLQPFGIRVGNFASRAVTLFRTLVWMSASVQRFL